VLHECVEQAVLAERMGFDRVWAVGTTAQVVRPHERAETFLAYVAGATSRIRRHGVVCLPFKMNHLIKVAERIAMLDVLPKDASTSASARAHRAGAGAFDTRLEDIRRSSRSPS
jgi:hypothetical protein